jgi:hypothetical protein
MARPDGTLLKASGPEIAVMAGGVRRWVPDPPTFTYMGLDWGKVVTISDSEWSTITSGPPYPSRADGTLLQGSGPKVYVMTSGQRHWIPDPATFNASGYQWSAIKRVADADLTAIPEGVAVVESAVTALNATSAQLAETLARLGSQPVSSADLTALQASIAEYTTNAAVVSGIVKEYADSLKSIVQKMSIVQKIG